MCQFAEKSLILNIIFPNIASKEYFDDRMADTYDHLWLQQKAPPRPQTICLVIICQQ
jgi:hypothetical protein